MSIKLCILFELSVMYISRYLSIQLIKQSSVIKLFWTIRVIFLDTILKMSSVKSWFEKKNPIKVIWTCFKDRWSAMLSSKSTVVQMFCWNIFLLLEILRFRQEKLNYTYADLKNWYQPKIRFIWRNHNVQLVDMFLCVEYKYNICCTKEKK